MSCFFQGENSQRRSDLRRRGRLPCARCFGQLCFFKISQNETKSSNKSRPSCLFWRLEKTEDKSGVETETSDHLLSDEKTEFIFIDAQSTPIHRTSVALRAPVTRKLSKSVCVETKIPSGGKENPDGLYTECVCRKSSTYSITCKCLTYNLNVTWGVTGFPTITD